MPIETNLRYFTVYKITNLLNGKYYIGAHATEFLEDDYMGSGKLIQKAIKKHGKCNFKKEILHICETEFEMYEIEKSLVVLNSNTYNMAPGGRGGVYSILSRKGIPHSEESKIKMRNSALGKHTGSKNGNYGRIFPEETRKKMSEKQSKLWEVTFPDKSKKIIKNLKRFCLDNNLDLSSMHQVANKKNRKQHKGFSCKSLGGV